MVDRISDGEKVQEGWHHDGTKIVDNAGIGNVWVDKDLSAYVGIARRLVMLKVKERAAGAQWVVTRPDGDTDETSRTNWSGAGLCYLAAGEANELLVETNELGVIEWKASDNGAVDIWLLGYVD